jgi:hypothetical protein
MDAWFFGISPEENRTQTGQRTENLRLLSQVVPRHSHFLRHPIKDVSTEFSGISEPSKCSVGCGYASGKLGLPDGILSEVSIASPFGIRSASLVGLAEVVAGRSSRGSSGLLPEGAFRI